MLGLKAIVLGQNVLIDFWGLLVLQRAEGEFNAHTVGSAADSYALWVFDVYEELVTRKLVSILSWAL